MSPKSKEPGFEAILSEVESIVERLQEGSLPLEDALEMYETGYKRLKLAQKKLETARAKLETLRKTAEDDEEGEA